MIDWNLAGKFTTLKTPAKIESSASCQVSFGRF